MKDSTEVKVIPLVDAIWHEWLAKGRKRDELTAYRFKLLFCLTPVMFVLAWFMSRS